MLHDAQGLAVTTDDPRAIEGIDTFVDQFTAYGRGFDPVTEGAAAVPDCAVLQAHAAALQMFLEAGDSPALAAPYIAAAKANAAQGDDREQLYVAAIDAWVAGDKDKAIELHQEIARRWPRDIGSAKLCQYHQFNRGDLDGMLQTAETVFEANRENPVMHGMLAFALEERNRLDEAEAAGRRAVEMRRAEPWAHHAVAHVMEVQGRIDEGIAWMEAHSDTWDDCNSFMLTHNWWHLALYYLDREEFDKVRALYDDRVWGAWKEYSQDQVNATSLLWRLELRGSETGDRWQDVGAYVAARKPEHVEPFLDLHYLYALGRAGREDERAELLASLERHAAAAGGAWAEVAVPAARGLSAYLAGDHATAHGSLAPVIDRMQEIGGSHAQRDLFTQTWIDVLLRSGRADQAATLLRGRAEARPKAPAGWRLLADAERAAG